MGYHQWISDYKNLGCLAERSSDPDRFGTIRMDFAQIGVRGESGAWEGGNDGGAEQGRRRAEGPTGPAERSRHSRPPRRSERNTRRTQAKSRRRRPNHSGSERSAAQQQRCVDPLDLAGFVVFWGADLEWFGRIGALLFVSTLQ